MTFTHAVATNNYGPQKWIVSDTATGTHTTLGGALASASAGDTIFLRISVTENVTLKNGVDIIGPNPCTNKTANNISITGKLIDNNVAVNCSITNIALVTNSDYCISLASLTSVINLFSCFVNGSNNTILNYTSNAAIIFQNCFVDLGTTAIALSVTTGQVVATNTVFTNSGSSALSSDPVNSSYGFYDCVCNIPLVCSGSGSFAMYNCQLIVSGVNQYTIGTSGSGDGFSFNNCYIYNNTTTVANFGSSVNPTAKFYNCYLNGASNQTALITSSSTQLYAYNSTFVSGTASAISIGTGSTVFLGNCDISSSNTNAITGLGSLYYGGTTFLSSSRKINTSTQTDMNFGTFTPNLLFGGANVSMTYTARNGWYQRQDSMISFAIYINLSAKGSSTGSATITGLPFASSANNITNRFFTVTNAVTLAGSAYVVADLVTGASSLSLFTINLATSTLGTVTAATCSNTSIFRLQGRYYI